MGGWADLRMQSAADGRMHRRMGSHSVIIMLAYMDLGKARRDYNLRFGTDGEITSEMDMDDTSR